MVRAKRTDMFVCNADGRKYEVVAMDDGRVDVAIHGDRSLLDFQATVANIHDRATLTTVPVGAKRAGGRLVGQGMVVTPSGTGVEVRVYGTGRVTVTVGGVWMLKWITNPRGKGGGGGAVVLYELHPFPHHPADR